MEEKGLMEEDWNDRDNWRKNIFVKWAQEDVETSYNLLNNNIYSYLLTSVRSTATEWKLNCSK